MSERIKAGAYVGVAGALSVAALPVAAYLAAGFDAADPRWWSWLLEYMLATRELPPALLYTLGGWAVATAAAIAFNPFSFARDDYGAASFARPSMLRKMGLTARSGVVLGRVGRRLLIYDRPLSTLVLAPPGAGKTAGVAIPTLLSFRGSVLVNDPKGEMFEATAGWRSRLGKVYRIEWSKGGKSTRWNPLSPTSLPQDPAELEIAVDRLAAIFVAADKAKGEDFWVKAGRDLLSAAILFHVYEAKRTGTEATLAGVLSWLAVDAPAEGGEDEEINDPVAMHFRRAAGVAEIEGYPCRITDALKSIANLNYRTRADVIKTVEAGLRVFRNSAVAEATSRSDFDLRELRAGGRPVSVYVVVPPADMDVFGPITGALMELAGKAAVSTSKGHPLLFLLDELAFIPELDIVKKGPAIGRGANVRFILIAQDAGQLVERYGKTGLDTILTTTAYKVVLTQNHHETQAMISRMVGNTTRRRVSVTRQGASGLFGRSSKSEGLEGVPLVRPEDLGSMRMGHQLVIAQEFVRHPIKSRSAFYFRDWRLMWRARISPPRDV